MSNIFVLILLILIVLVVIGIATALIISNKAAHRDRMLSVIHGKSYVSVDNKGGKTDQDKRREEISKKLKESEQNKDGKGEKKKRETIKALMGQAGMSISVKQFWIFSLLFAVLVTFVAKILGQGGFVLLMVFITAFIGLPRSFVKRKIKKRQKKFIEEFADALEAMVRLLKSGMPVTEAIAMVGREYTGPVGDEMSRIYDAQKVGVPLPEAVAQGAQRMPLTEMQMFATGIAIQAQTGASLSEVLMNLAGVIRARFRLKRKVQALSQEAKSSAAIIGALPFLVGSGLFALNPEYMDIMINTFAGKIMLVFGAVWMGAGIFVMKIMINFKI